MPTQYLKKNTIAYAKIVCHIRCMPSSNMYLIYNQTLYITAALVSIQTEPWVTQASTIFALFSCPILSTIFFIQNYLKRINAKATTVWSDLVNPELSNNDIVNCGSDFLPCVMITSPCKLEMSSAMWYNLQVLAPEFAGEREFLPEDPVLMLSMKGWCRRMMAHLQFSTQKVKNNFTIHCNAWSPLSNHNNYMGTKSQS